MAIRPVYLVSNGKVIKSEYEFQWYAGFSVAQKQRSIAALILRISNSILKGVSTLRLKPQQLYDLCLRSITRYHPLTFPILYVFTAKSYCVDGGYDIGGF